MIDGEQKVDASLMVGALKYKIKFTTAARDQIWPQPRNDTQILKAAALKFKAKRPNLAQHKNESAHKHRKRPSLKTNLSSKNPKRYPNRQSADQNAARKGRSDIDFLFFSDLLKFLFVMLFYALKG